MTLDEIINILADFLEPIFSAEIRISDDVVITPMSVFLCIIIVILFTFFSKIVQRAAAKHLLPRFKIQPSTEFVILKVFHYAIMAIAFWVVLDTLGFNMTSFTVIAGLLSVGIGFGLQNLASNFVSGLIILIEAPIKVGDWVQLGDLEGEVQTINLRATGIATNDGEYIIVPNQDLITSQVINGSKGPPNIRIHTPVGVSYSSDMKKVVEVLMTVANNHPEVIQDPKPAVWLTGFGDSSVDYDLLTWIKTPRDTVRIRAELNYKIWWALKEAEIEIPFPQRDLHIRSADISVPIEMHDDEKKTTDTSEE